MENTVGSSPNRVRHWRWLVLIPALLATLAGFLLSYAFQTRYTSQSQILLEGQKVPESMVQPPVTEDLTTRVATLEQKVLSQPNLQPVVERLGLAREGRSVSDAMDEIRANMSVSPVDTSFSRRGAESKPGESSSAPSFYINYTASNPREAQQVCNELTSLLVGENLKAVQAAASGTSDLLTREIEHARNTLLDLLTSLKTQGRDSEERRKLLSIDYDSAQKTYEDLLTKKRAADLTVAMNNMSLGERMFPLNPASLPDVADFPNRLIFAGAGLSVGLLLGIILALRLKFKRTSS